MNCMSLAQDTTLYGVPANSSVHDVVQRLASIPGSAHTPLTAEVQPLAWQLIPSYSRERCWSVVQLEFEIYPSSSLDAQKTLNGSVAAVACRCGVCAAQLLQLSAVSRSACGRPLSISVVAAEGQCTPGLGAHQGLAQSQSLHR